MQKQLFSKQTVVAHFGWVFVYFFAQVFFFFLLDTSQLSQGLLNLGHLIWFNEVEKFRGQYKGIFVKERSFFMNVNSYWVGRPGAEHIHSFYSLELLFKKQCVYLQQTPDTLKYKKYP